MVQVDLITGFLGAGKTTFLRRYVRYLVEQGHNVCILENDFGAVNVDAMLVQDLLGPRCDLETISGGCDCDTHQRRIKSYRLLHFLGMFQFESHAFRNLKTENIDHIACIHEFQSHFNSYHSLVGILLIKEGWKIDMWCNRDIPSFGNDLCVICCLLFVFLDVALIRAADKDFHHNNSSFLIRLSWP